MHRIVALLSIVTLVLLGGVVLGLQPRAIAQEATPAMDDAMEEAFAPVSFALGVELASPVDIFVARITLAPGQ